MCPYNPIRWDDTSSAFAFPLDLERFDPAFVDRFLESMLRSACLVRLITSLTILAPQRHASDADFRRAVAGTRFLRSEEKHPKGDHGSNGSTAGLKPLSVHVLAGERKTNLRGPATRLCRQAQNLRVIRETCIVILK